jgi:hypothetical protein
MILIIIETVVYHLNQNYIIFNFNGKFTSYDDSDPRHARARCS